MYLPLVRNKVVEVTPAVSTSAYADKDAINTGGIITLPNVVSSRGDVAYLAGITVTDAANQKSALSLYFFNAAIASTFTDNAVFDPTDAEILANFVGYVALASASYISLNDNAVGTQTPAYPIAMKTKNSTNLYLAIVSAGTPTYVAAADLKFRFTFGSRN